MKAISELTPQRQAELHMLFGSQSSSHVSNQKCTRDGLFIKTTCYIKIIL